MIRAATTARSRNVRYWRRGDRARNGCEPFIDQTRFSMTSSRGGAVIAREILHDLLLVRMAHRDASMCSCFHSRVSPMISR